MIWGDIIRCFVKKYNFFYKKVKSDIRICLISDIHFSRKFNINNLSKLKSKFDHLNPNYIVIAGDIIDSLEIVDDDLFKYFYSWLKDISSCYKVIVCLGNHDVSYNKSIIPSYKSNSLYKKYYNKLTKLNIYLLNNSVYEDKYVRFVGFFLPVSSYHNNSSLNVLKDFYNDLDFNLFLGSKNKLNICIVHNPMNICNDDIKNILRNFDIILAGHMHNGLVLSFIDRIIPGNRGIIDPDKKFMPSVSRNMVCLSLNKYLIISGGITKLSAMSGIFHYGNFLFPMEIDDIIIFNKK